MSFKIEILQKLIDDKLCRIINNEMFIVKLYDNDIFLNDHISDSLPFFSELRIATELKIESKIYYDDYVKELSTIKFNGSSEKSKNIFIQIEFLMGKTDSGVHCRYSPCQFCLELRSINGDSECMRNFAKHHLMNFDEYCKTRLSLLHTEVNKLFQFIKNFNHFKARVLMVKFQDGSDAIDNIVRSIISTYCYYR